jgi:nickel-dependent lactate racemase
MALIDLPFDGGTLSFEINDANLAEVLSPKPSRPIADLDTAIAAALDSPIGQEPLQKWVKPGDKVLIISDDNTRLTPADRMIPPISGPAEPGRGARWGHPLHHGPGHPPLHDR